MYNINNIREWKQSVFITEASSLKDALKIACLYEKLAFANNDEFPIYEVQKGNKVWTTGFYEDDFQDCDAACNNYAEEKNFHYDNEIYYQSLYDCDD